MCICPALTLPAHCCHHGPSAFRPSLLLQPVHPEEHASTGVWDLKYAVEERKQVRLLTVLQLALLSEDSIFSHIRVSLIILILYYADIAPARCIRPTLYVGVLHLGLQGRQARRSGRYCRCRRDPNTTHIKQKKSQLRSKDLLDSSEAAEIATLYSNFQGLESNNSLCFKPGK